jgi:ATP-dependent Clp protease ATP-binding subunit ClpA
LLTEAIRKTPHSVLLLDEIEKAHADILNILLQVMDYGTLTDNNGKKADFSNTVIIMTSNAGAREMAKPVIGFDGKADAAAVDKAVERIFPPEFRNRLDGIVPFNPVDEAMAGLIARKALDRLTEKLLKRGVTFEPTGEAVEYIAKKGLSAQFGAREIIRVVENDVKRILVDEVLFGERISDDKAVLDVADGKFILKR